MHVANTRCTVTIAVIISKWLQYHLYRSVNEFQREHDGLRSYLKVQRQEQWKNATLYRGGGDIEELLFSD